MSSSLYETITGQIVAAIEDGAGLYRMPWHRKRQDVTNPVNLISSRAYRGLNIVTLWMTGEAKGYGSGTWATYQQWQQKGCQVRKGEKAAPVFFWKKLGGAEDATPQPDDAADRPFFVAKGYSVFNADQVEGYTPAVPVLSEAERIARAEAFSSPRSLPRSAAAAARLATFRAGMRWRCRSSASSAARSTITACSATS